MNLLVRLKGELVDAGTAKDGTLLSVWSAYTIAVP